MAGISEIDYDVLIDRSIRDFRPVKRLWPISIRLSLWIALEAMILALGILFKERSDDAAVIYFNNYGFAAAGFLLTSVAAAWMALRNSIPGCETNTIESVLLSIGIVVAALMARFEPLSRILEVSDFTAIFGRQWSCAILPCVVLFWAARRATPLRPELTGGMIGVAASCFAIAANLFNGPLYPITWELLAGTIFTLLSIIAGAALLDPEKLRRKVSTISADRVTESVGLAGRIIFPLATALSAALVLLVLRAGTGGNLQVPDFDLAIASYQQSVTNFRPNVPSNSLETLLTAYIDRGMPSYMWDFGPQGFKLVGGRFENLADGTPVTYTLFRGPKAGVMCMFRQTNGFQIPVGNHIERNHLLFYRYRHYSVCLFNVGGYGDFVSVIVSPMPMNSFMSLVLNALSSNPP
jgi:Negative regulator of sigma F